MAQSIFSETVKLVVFELSSEEFGIDINKIDSILRMQIITNIPYAAKFIEGIINYRGQPLVVVDLRKRFNLPLNSVKEENMRIVVLDFQPFLLGMIVDAVTEVLSLPLTMIEPVPDNLISLEIEQEYLLGVGNLDDGERLIVLLDLGKIFSGEELEDLGLLFGREHEIRSFLEQSRETRDKQVEDRRLASSQAALTTTSESSMATNSYRSTQSLSKEKFLEREQAMIRKMALREIQEELGININVSSSEEETVYLEEGEELSEEEGVEYVYVDEEGNEIAAPEITQIESSDDLHTNDSSLEHDADVAELITEAENPTMDSPFDADVEALIAAAESDNLSSETGSDDILDAAADTPIDNNDVAALIAAVQAKKKKAVEGSTEALTAENIASFEKYLKSLTKAKLVSTYKDYPDLKLSKKMKKADLISSISVFLQENHPEVMLITK